jgi:hypothetical protein
VWEGWEEKQKKSGQAGMCRKTERLQEGRSRFKKELFQKKVPVPEQGKESQGRGGTVFQDTKPEGFLPVK